jgi:hypothetical protein
VTTLLALLLLASPDAGTKSRVEECRHALSAQILAIEAWGAACRADGWNTPACREEDKKAERATCLSIRKCAPVKNVSKLWQIVRLNGWACPGANALGG